MIATFDFVGGADLPGHLEQPKVWEEVAGEDSALYFRHDTDASGLAMVAVIGCGNTEAPREQTSKRANLLQFKSHVGLLTAAGGAKPLGVDVVQLMHDDHDTDINRRSATRLAGGTTAARAGVA